MVKMSETVKEIIQIVVFLMVVGLLLTVFVLYPLNRTKAILSRPDVEKLDNDSLPANDPTGFDSLGAIVDTFRIDADGLTNLACVYLTPAGDSATTEPSGTVILLHDERQDRKGMIPLATLFLDSGYTVCLYDQRASGLSSANYHSDGEFEAVDLAEVIAYLGLRDMIHHPFFVVGQSSGADAVLIVARTDDRLDGLVAIEPYITSERWLDMLFDEHDTYWIPFPQTIFEFWYELRSGYAPQYRGFDDLRAVKSQALVLVSQNPAEIPELARLIELSETDLVKADQMAPESELVAEAIMQFLQTTPAASEEQAD